MSVLYEDTFFAMNNFDHIICSTTAPTAEEDHIIMPTHLSIDSKRRIRRDVVVDTRIESKN